MPPAPGMTPRLISGWPKVAVGEARMMSVERASSQPPPSWVGGWDGMCGGGWDVWEERRVGG